MVTFVFNHTAPAYMSVWLSSSVTVNPHKAQYMECFVNMKLDTQPKDVSDHCITRCHYWGLWYIFDTGIWFSTLENGTHRLSRNIVRNYHYSLHNNPEDGSSLFGTGSLMRPKCFAQERCSTSICVSWKLLVHTWHSTWADISFEPCIAFHFNWQLLALGHFLQVEGHWVDKSQTYSCSTVENKGYYHLLDTQSNFWEFLSQMMHGQYVSFHKGSLGK
jgi:hypothetical protein